MICSCKNILQKNRDGLTLSFSMANPDFLPDFLDLKNQKGNVGFKLNMRLWHKREGDFLKTPSRLSCFLLTFLKGKNQAKSQELML